MMCCNCESAELVIEIEMNSFSISILAAIIHNWLFLVLKKEYIITTGENSWNLDN